MASTVWAIGVGFRVKGHPSAGPEFRSKGFQYVDSSKSAGSGNQGFGQANPATHRLSRARVVEKALQLYMQQGAAGQIVGFTSRVL